MIKINLCVRRFIVFTVGLRSPLPQVILININQWRVLESNQQDTQSLSSSGCLQTLLPKYKIINHPYQLCRIRGSNLSISHKERIEPNAITASYNLCKYVESNHNLNFSVAQHDFGTLRSVFLFLSSSDLSYHISFIKLRFP